MNAFILTNSSPAVFNSIYPSGTESEAFRDNYDNSLAANTMAPYIAMELCSRHDIDPAGWMGSWFHEEGFQPPALSQFWKRIEKYGSIFLKMNS